MRNRAGDHKRSSSEKTGQESQQGRQQGDGMRAGFLGATGLAWPRWGIKLRSVAASHSLQGYKH
jgi:hypothetical protein